MPVFTVPITGNNGPGYVTVNATDAASAVNNVGAGNVASGAPISGGPANIPGGGNATGGTPANPANATVSNNAALQQISNQVNSLLGAIASGNKQAFDEAVRQFNLSFGLDKDKFTEAIRQFNENLAIAQSGVTGVYNGQQTQQAALQAANIAAQVAGLTGYYQSPMGQQGTGNMAVDGFQTKASDSDRATYLAAENNNTQAAAEHWLRDVTGAVRNAVTNAGGQFTPNSMAEYIYGPQAAPQATLAAQNQWATLYGQNGPPVAGQETLAANQQRFTQQLQAIQTAAQLQANPFRQAQAIGQLGGVLGGGAVAGFQAPGAVTGQTDFSGMGNMQRMIDDIRGGPGAVNSQTTNSVLDRIPTPNKVDSVNFMKSSPLTQNLVLQGMQEKYGLAPEDSLAQIKNTLPQFQSPTTFGTVKR